MSFQLQTPSTNSYLLCDIRELRKRQDPYLVKVLWPAHACVSVHPPHFHTTGREVVYDLSTIYYNNYIHTIVITSNWQDQDTFLVTPMTQSLPLMWWRCLPIMTEQTLYRFIPTSPDRSMSLFSTSRIQPDKHVSGRFSSIASNWQRPKPR